MRDLGVLVDSDLNFCQHSIELAKKCNQLIGTICKTFKNKSLRVKAVETYVYPRVEYCSTICSPYHLKNIDLIESVSSRFTKCLIYPNQYYNSVEGGNYEERLASLNLISFEMRRFQRDLIMAHKL